jgi:hypothetical protein
MLWSVYFMSKQKTILIIAYCDIAANGKYKLTFDEIHIFKRNPANGFEKIFFRSFLSRLFFLLQAERYQDRRKAVESRP